MGGTVGISAYGTYVPYWRLRHDVIREALGSVPTRGSRAVAGYDEDSTTLAVEAARRALRGPAAAEECDAVVLATSAPVYADKTNATAIHAALGLRGDVHAGDATGAVRSGVSALLGSFYRPGCTLVAMSDLRTGPSGSADESSGGDGAAAFVVGDGSGSALVAELLGTGSSTREFLDRWRGPGEAWSSTWEERFGEDLYSELAMQAFDSALKAAGLTADQVDLLAVTGLSGRAAATLGKRTGVSGERIIDNLVSTVGDCGTAHAGLLLAGMLDAAGPGKVLVLAVLADGADVLIFRTTDAHTQVSAADGVLAQIMAGKGQVSYVDFLAWRGLLQRQQPRRPDPDRAVAPASNRLLDWKFAFVGSECAACGTRHLPPQRVCLRCGATDQMKSCRLADTAATIATYTVDHLAFSLAPPMVGAVLDFDGGGRYACELTDLDLADLAVGQRVEMTFRRLSTANGIHNYFWKARPVYEGQPR